MNSGQAGYCQKQEKKNVENFWRNRITEASRHWTYFSERLYKLNDETTVDLHLNVYQK